MSKSLIILTVAILAALGCAPESPPAPRGEAAPAFELQRLDGTAVRLADLRGKTVLVDFWATWCPPCVLEIPELNAVWERHRGTDVEILAVSIDSDPAAEIAAWVKEKGVLYPVALADLELATAYDALEFPYHLIIGPEGTVLERLQPGYHDRDELEEALARNRS